MKNIPSGKPHVTNHGKTHRALLGSFPYLLGHGPGLGNFPPPGNDLENRTVSSSWPAMASGTPGRPLKPWNLHIAWWPTRRVEPSLKLIPLIFEAGRLVVGGWLVVGVGWVSWVSWGWLGRRDWWGGVGGVGQVG